MTHTERQGLIAGLLAVACWAGFVLVSRAGGRSPLTPWDIMAIRFGVGSLLLLPFLRPGRLWWNLRGLTLALVGGIGYGLAVYQGFRLTSAVHAAVMLPGLIPFGAALFAALILGDRPSLLRWLGLLAIAVGGALMLASTGGHGDPAGDLWLVAAVLCWSLYTVLARRWQVPAWTGAITTALWSAALFLPVYVLWLPGNLAAATTGDILLQCVYQGLIATVVAMLLYLRAVSSIGPSAMGALMALVPVISGLLAVPVLGESLSGVEAIALVVASAGAVLASGLLRRRALVL
jgi:drug/metabolite transporter (DMT)-like permease